MSEELSEGPAEIRVDEVEPPRLFGPERLNTEEASRLLARGPGRLVVWVGEEPEDTRALSAALYESQRRERGATRFAGSWTLLAFEHLIGHGAVASVEHADDEGREVLHLALSVNDEPIHLLFAELPGEAFRRLADNEAAADDGPWLRRADRIAFVVDGRRIRDPTTRAMVLTRVRQFVERLRASQLPDQGCRLALVVVRWDRVQDDLETSGYWGAREADLLADLRTLDVEAQAVHVANGNGPDDHGIAGVRAWLLGTAPPALDAPLAPLVPAQSSEPLDWGEPLHAVEPIRAPEPPPPVEAPPAYEEPRYEEPRYEEPRYEEPRYEERPPERGPAYDDEWLYGPPPRRRLPWRRRK
jgi:Double-GTPase 2